MRKFPAALLLACLLLSACAPLAVLSTPGGGQSSASLGPDGVSEAQSASTLPDRVKSGVDWLWSSYTALKARVDPAVEPMKKLYVAAQEMVVAVEAKDWLRALALYGTARGLVTEIAGMVGK
ncbi:MAG: hypothetical protein AB7D37_11100 [Desulfovibrio sp.]